MALTNLQLVEFCNKALALGNHTMYLYGTYGKTVTTSLINSKVKQYSYNVGRQSGYIKALTNDKTIRGLDCVGLIKWFLWTNNNITKEPVYNALHDKSANGYYNIASKKGDIKKIPEVKGLAVQMDGHIGIYIGNGYVIECTPSTTYAKQSHKMGGVCKTKLSDRKWTHYLYIPFIDYVAEPKAEEKKPTTEKETTSTTPKVGDKYTLKCSMKIYNTASNALNAKDAKGTYAKGDYYIYKVYGKAYNITRKKGVPGGWIDPSKNK